MTALTFGSTVNLDEMRRALRLTVVATVAVAVAICLTACGDSKKKHEAAVSSATTTSTTSGSGSSTTGGSHGSPKNKPGATGNNPGSSATKPGPHAKNVAVMTSQFGNVLNAPGGHALYVFTQDKPGGPSTCYGECASKWPPFIVK